MPTIAVYHPQIVHFVVALGITGVVLRILAFTPWFAFANVAARALILAAAAASYFAAMSGTQAHGPVERIPGAREAVQEHEEAGEWARDWLIGVAVLELVGWALAKRRPKVARGAMALSAVAGVVAVGTVYRAAKHGGDLVYRFAGGVGTRSGDTTDVGRLLAAALYNGALADRKAGRDSDAARLVDELARRHPNDTSVHFMTIDSRIRDRHDPRGALASLDSLHPAPTDRRMLFQVTSLKADAYIALGQRDSARLALETLQRALGGTPNPRLQARIDSLR